MNHKERFYATVERKPVDRPASWFGLPHPDALKGLFDYFDANNMKELKAKIGDDIYPVDIPYNSPESDAVVTALDFAKDDLDERTLTAPGFFEDFSDPDRVDEFDWPEPEKYIDSEECKKIVEDVPDDYPVMGVLWSAHFQDACSAFGMETAMIKMMTEPEMYRAVIDKITEFYLKANEVFYKAVADKLDAVLIGNDFGAQTGLMLSPDLLRQHVFPGTKALVDQAKSYDLKVIHHSCGAVRDVIPDLIDLDIDVIHPIQAKAEGMEPQGLKDDFGDEVSFCGGVDAQNLLVLQSPEKVKKKVRELKDIFPTGLVISPSHEAVLPDVDPANIEALFNAIKE